MPLRQQQPVEHRNERTRQILYSSSWNGCTTINNTSITYDTCMYVAVLKEELGNVTAPSTLKVDMVTLSYLYKGHQKQWARAQRATSCK